ncbi:MAG: hypothetical protein WD646_02210 [Actinomycetota bacterium]
MAFWTGLRLEGQSFLGLQTGAAAFDLQDRTFEAYRAGGDPI